jgi:transcriptional regulator with XRE-family HTH domain
MTLAAEAEFSAEQSRRIAATVREELARRRISRQRLADDAKISISTLEKALSGRRPFTLATTVRLESALGVPLRPAASPAPAPLGHAPESLGAYSRAAVSWLEGAYLTLRPSFDHPGSVYAYLTEISWDEAGGRLVFAEAARLDADFTQKGEVSLPHQSGHLYLITNDHGQFRLAILNRPTIGGHLYGLLTTLQSGPGSHLTPAATPIALVRASAGAAPVLGWVGPQDASYGPYRAHIERITDQAFARFFT